MYVCVYIYIYINIVQENVVKSLRDTLIGTFLWVIFGFVNRNEISQNINVTF